MPVAKDFIRPIQVPFLFSFENKTRAHCWILQTYCLWAKMSIASMWKHVRGGAFLNCKCSEDDNICQAVSFTIENCNWNSSRAVERLPLPASCTRKRVAAEEVFEFKGFFCVLCSFGDVLSSGWHSPKICALFLQLQQYWSHCQKDHQLDCAHSYSVAVCIPVFWYGTSHMLLILWFPRVCKYILKINL